MPRDLLADQPVKGPRDLLAEPEPEPKEEEKQPIFSGGIIPYSVSPEGDAYFDPHAGILAPFMLPGDVLSGKVDPTSEEGLDESFWTALAATPVSPALRLPTLLPRTDASRVAGVPVPGIDDLKGAGKAGLKQVKGMGVKVKATPIGDMAKRLKSELEADSILRDAAPKVFKQLDKLEAASAGGALSPLTGVANQSSKDLAELIGLRRILQDASRDFKKSGQREAANRAIVEIDEFITAANPAAVRSNPAVAAEAGRIYKDANANYAAGSRSAALTGTAAQRASKEPGILPKAELQAAGSHSGLNLDNVLRQRVTELLADPKRASGHSPAEIAKLEAFVAGKGKRNTLRSISNVLGGGGGLGRLLAGGGGATAGGTIGGLLAGPWGATAGATIGGAVTPAVGSALKTAQNQMSRSALQAVDKAVRMRSPLYEELMKAAKAGGGELVTRPGKYATIAKALLVAMEEAQAAEAASHTYGPGGNTL